MPKAIRCTDCGKLRSADPTKPCKGCANADTPKAPKVKPAAATSKRPTVANVDGSALWASLRAARDAGLIAAVHHAKGGRTEGGKRSTVYTILETPERDALTFRLIGDGAFQQDRDGLGSYVAGLQALDGWWTTAQLADLQAIADTRTTAPTVPATVGDATLPDYVTEWLDRLVSTEKREYAAAYCAWNLNLVPDAPADPGKGWAEKARKRADRLFREPFDRAAAGASI